MDGDRTLLEYKFTRRPLVVCSTLKGSGEKLYNVVLHLKSKYVSRGQFMWTSGRVEEVDEFVNKSIAARRRIAAECLRVRNCIVDTIMRDAPNAAVIVSGDFNSGPGLDFFEEHYGIFDMLQSLLGTPFYHTETLFATMDSNDENAFSVRLFVGRARFSRGRPRLSTTTLLRTSSTRRLSSTTCS